MPTKVIMCWNVRKETESEYFEFLVHEFIPGMTHLGIEDIQVWYTAYGDCEQKLASGVTSNADQMSRILTGDDWLKLTDKLNEFVEGYSQKIISATRGFQI